MRMRNRRLYLALSIIFGVLFGASFIYFLVLLITGLLDEYIIVSYSLLSAIPLFSILLVYFVTRYLTANAMVKNLMGENRHNLGEATTFFGLTAFLTQTNRISRLSRFRKRKQYLISFTATNLAIMQNPDRDDMITLLNSKIAKYLNKLAIINNKKARNSFIPCFNRGTFLIFYVNDDEYEITRLVDNITAEIFSIAEKNQIHIYVQPFFGVAEIHTNTNLLETIEDANIARGVSERNFETLTYYHDSFRKRSSREEINEINEALMNNEFVVYYQPKFSLGTKRFISSEALIRWDSKKHGLLSPSKFIPIVEQAGLVHEIDTFVFRRVCEDLNEAKKKGKRILPVSINFSLYEFYSSEFLNSIMDLLDNYQINPSLIEIEITEATSRANSFTAISIIKKLREKGIRVLMDDFGVGYSNIGNLRKIPFDAVKIDKSFIDDIAFDLKSRAIVKFLIELCQANDLEVIAEGVSSKEQVEILKKYKCNTIQGFYYSQALSLKDYEKFLANNPFERKENDK